MNQEAETGPELEIDIRAVISRLKFLAQKCALLEANWRTEVELNSRLTAANAKLRDDLAAAQEQYALFAEGSTL